MHSIKFEGYAYKLQDVYENIRYATEFIAVRKTISIYKYMLRTAVCSNAFTRTHAAGVVSYVPVNKSNVVFNPLISAAVYPVPQVAESLFKDDYTDNMRSHTYATLYVFEHNLALLFNRRNDNSFAWSLLLRNEFTGYRFEWFQFWYSSSSMYTPYVYRALKNNELSFDGHLSQYERTLTIGYGPDYPSTTRDYLPTFRI